RRAAVAPEPDSALAQWLEALEQHSRAAQIAAALARGEKRARPPVRQVQPHRPGAAAWPVARRIKRTGPCVACRVEQLQFDLDVLREQRAVVRDACDVFHP